MGTAAYVVEVENLSVRNVMEPEKGLSLAMSVTEMESVPNAGEGGSHGIISDVLNVVVAGYVKDAKVQERQNLNAETATAREKSNVSNVRETESAGSAKAKESLIAIDVTEPENAHAAMAEDIFAVRIVKAKER